MKLSFVIPNLNGGGAEKVLCSILNELVKTKNNYIVHLILVKKEGVYIDSLDERVIIFDLKQLNVRNSLVGIANYLKSEKPDFFVSSLDYMNLVSSFAHLISRSESKLILWEHNHLSIHSKKTISKSSILNKLIVRYFYIRSSKIISVSKGVKNDLVKNFNIPKNKITTCYNPGYDIDIFDKSLNSDPDIPKFGEYIISVGRLSKQKNYSNLLKAFNYLKKNNKKKIKLVIVGEGPEYNNIIENIKSFGLTKDVVLVGFKKNPFPLIMNASVFVLSSDNEGFGLVLVEALALGKQIVSTDCQSGPKEILKNGEFGQLVPVGNYKRLAVSINKSLNGEIFFDENSLLERAKDFSIEKSSRSFTRIINSI